MIKKVLTLTVAVILCFFNICTVYGQPSISCQSAILIDLDTGTVLADKEPDMKLYPASTTKIMTAILALEMGNLTDMITVDEDTPYEIGAGSSHVALEPGEILSLKDLLYALMLPSANDAASVIAKHYGGSLEKFVVLMNEKAKEVGANNTHFMNPHGLHDDNHYTTASDLAKIASYAMQNETFREIVKTPRYTIPATNKKSEARNIITTNHILLNTSPSKICIDGVWISREYEGAYGIKTGYTPEAGNCLVSYATRDDLNLVAVVLKGTGDEVYTDTHNLLNYGFNNFKSTTLINSDEFIQNIDIPNSDAKYISVFSQDSVRIVTDKTAANHVTSKVTLDKINLPLQPNSVVGKIDFMLDGKLVGSSNLVSHIAVNKIVEETFMEKLSKTQVPLAIKIILIILVILYLIRLYNKIRIKIIRAKRKKRKQKKQRLTQIKYD